MTTRQSTSRRARRPFFHATIIAIAIAAAFYATFLPTRHSTHANGFVNPAEGLSYSGAIVAQPVPSVPTVVSALTVIATPPPAPPVAESVTTPDDQDSRIEALALGTQTVTPTPIAATPTPNPATLPGAPTATATARPGSTSTPTPKPGSVPATPQPGAATVALAGAPGCDPAQSSLYCVYTIQPGDTLSTVAARFGLKGNDDVTAAQLLVQSNKPDIVSDTDLLQISQKLRIPTNAAAAASLGGPSSSASTAVAATTGSLIHTVLSSETLLDIAGDYGVTVDDIVKANAGTLTDPNRLSIGQELRIPNPKQVAKPAPVVAPVPSTSGSGSSSGSAAASPNVPASVPIGPKSNVGFIWPTTGPISSYFGPSHPLGIDIDLYNNPNAPIAAVAAGTVTFAGGNTCCSYGLYVIVDHGNGYQTLYAHMSRLNVSVGQTVSQGTVLGLGGRTGYATGNHLHFEVHLNGNIVNPLSYLP